MTSPVPDDNQAYRFPVSVKGVVFLGGKVALLHNRRNEWELPGGKLEPGETPESCLRREMAEELALPVEVGRLIDAWVYHITQGVDVLILTYGCSAGSAALLTHSAEHTAAGLFSVAQLAGLNMPEGYRQSIRRWAEQLGL